MNNERFVTLSNGKRIIQNWEISTKFLVQASHKNNIGTETDEKLHSHVWRVEICGEYHKLNKNHILFNFKVIAPFIFNLLNDKNLNDILEHKDKHIDRYYLSNVEDLPEEPSNEVMGQLIGRLVMSKIAHDDPGMTGVKINVVFDKEDNIKENEVCKNKKISLCAETHTRYSCMEIKND